MKKIILTVILFCFIPALHAQSPDTDSSINNILSEKNDTLRFMKVKNYVSETQESNPVMNLKILQKLLQQSGKNKDEIIKAFTLSMLGYQFRAIGDKAKGLEYSLQGLQLAEMLGYPSLTAVTQLNLANNYAGLGDYDKALELYSNVENTASETGNLILQSLSTMKHGSTYLEMNKYDSALIYLQKAEELSIRGNYSDYRDLVYNDLGSAHGKLGNPELAITYFNLAVKHALENNTRKGLSVAYYNIANYYFEEGKKDSAVLYAGKSIDVLKNTPFTTWSLKPAGLLMDIYRNKNNDSAIKYSDMYRLTKDSLFNSKVIQQTQLLSFNEELRQQKIIEEKIRAEEENKMNLQYILITIGILFLIILYLLLSHSIISNENMIKYFGIITLLFVFEFLNLFLHPLLERITEHNPVLVLLASVCLAALLVPLHHKLENLAIHKLVDKNKKIRLAAAKKTIEELEV